MNVLMKPFIGIYHVVRKVFSFPVALFSKTEDKIIEAKDRKELHDNDKLPNEHKSGLMKNKDEDKKDRPLKKYRYVVINSMNRKETGIFEAENESEVKNFLLAQDYQVVSVKLRAAYDIEINDYQKMKSKDLAFSLTQLSTYIKSGIPLVDAVKILEKQTKKVALKRSFQRLVYELLNGENLSGAMKKQNKVYPNLLVNMVKTAELTGDLASILDDMSEYYTSMEQTRKQMISAMTYPVVVLTVAFGVLVFMLTYLVPQFAVMFEENNAKLPALTLAILNVSNFVKDNFITLLLGLIFIIVVFVVMYKKVQPFRKFIQIILMHIPIIKDIIIYSQVSNFTKTFASLLNHGVFITDSMEVLSKVTNNEVYKEIIKNCLTSLGKGDSISEAFKGEWAFPVVAYEMLVTGESTGQLGLMMEKVADHFQSLHKTLIDQMKSLMEPLMIMALAGIVGIILLSIVEPMFSIYGQIK
ncbi:MAG: type II secretion system F family protein [Bacilli bacterium]|nr:type II secretion system F family protein [Bacilli bacterium]